MSVPMIVLLHLGGAAAVLLAVSIALMCAACAPMRWLTRDLDRAVARSSFRRYADEIRRGRHWIDGREMRELHAISFDGLRLFARYFPTENARGTVLMFHGWRSIGDLDFSCAFELYASMGLNLLVVDQRAHGRSQGRFTTFGVRERRDVHTWVDFCNEHFGAETPLLIGGVSMGATSVLMACGEPFPANVRGVIADCGFTSPYDIICKVARDRRVPVFPFVPLVGLQTRLLGGFGLKDYSTETAMRAATVPIFFAHGEADAFVPCEMSRRAYDACASADKTLLTVPNAGHGASYLVEKTRYEQLLRAFVDRVMM